jgi:3-carboxy-cis,cis-muconate cycloisomerase
VSRNLAAPFLPLAGLFGDEEFAALFSENALIESWLKVERALAIVQAELGLIPATAATSIVAEAVATKIDRKVLRADTRTVGYPILPLLEQISHKSPADVADFIHWGATTQDIMDTALSLQVALALTRMEQLVVSLGDALAGLADKNRSIPMAGRTHAQVAVPITFGY